MNTKQERSAFEAWCKRNEYDLVQRLDGTGYNNEATKQAWQAWQARAALQSQPSQPEISRDLLAERDALAGALMAIEGMYEYDMPVGEAAMALYEASNIARAALAQEVGDE